MLPNRDNHVVSYYFRQGQSGTVMRNEPAPMNPWRCAVAGMLYGKQERGRLIKEEELYGTPQSQ